MKRFIKKASIAALAVVMLLITAIATTPAETQAHTLSPQNAFLRQVFEDAGARVDWIDGRIIVTLQGGEQTSVQLIYTLGAAYAQINSTQFQLSAPVIIVDSRAMISEDDLDILFAQPPVPSTDVEPVQGEFAATIAMTQGMAAQVMEQMGIAAMTVALVDAETGFTWTQGFGLADTQNNRPADADTLFQIGSISKPITAMAVMQLVEQELIDLDNPLVTYIPEFSILPNPRHDGSSDDITVRMLLNNTSGVPSNWMRGFYTFGSEHYQGSMNNLLGWLATRELSFVPGSMYEYANNNWALLGILVARVTGHSNYFEGFVEYTDEYIFAPLGMTRSSFEHTAAMTNVAQPHIAAGMQQPMHLVSFLSAGSVQASANDMARLMHFILGSDGAERILSEETVSYMLQNQNANLAGAAPYGLGFAFTRNADGFETVGHSGGTIHYFSNMIFSVENGLGVFISTNSSTGALGTVPVSEAILQTALMEKTGSVPLSPEESPIDPAAVPVELSGEDTAALANLLGLYSFGPFGMFDLTLEDGELVWVDSHGVPEPPLVPLSDGSFQGHTGRYLFIADGDNVSVLYIMEALGGIMASRIDAEAYLAPANSASLVGTYYFAPAFANEVPSITAIEISTFRDMLIMTMHSPSSDLIAEMLGGAVSGSPMQYDSGVWFATAFTDVATPVAFSTDAQGNSVIDFMGAQYVRR